jgi:chromosome segregation ATPase
MMSELKPINKSLTEVNTRLGSLDKNMVGVNTRLEGVDEKLSNVENKLSNLQVNDIRTQSKLEAMSETLKLIPKLYNSVDKMMSEVLSYRQEKFFIKSRLDDHEKRISKIELGKSIAQ